MRKRNIVKCSWPCVLSVFFLLGLMARSGGGANPAGPAEAKNDSTPIIEIDSVSAFGARPGLVAGRVRNIDPATHRVATIIFITGMGWFSKPFCASTTVPLDSEGSFRVTLTTGGADEVAQRIALYVVPAQTSVPCTLNAPGVPEDLEQQAVTRLILLRPDPAQRLVRLSDVDWLIKSVPVPVGPGPNLFSASEESVFVDGQGNLHLKIRRESGRWMSSEVYSRRAFGYGTYTVVLASPPHQDPNAILGIFTWAEAERTSREIDLLEIGKFGDAQRPENAQVVVAPFDQPGHLNRFSLPGTAPTTHRMIWEPTRIVFQSFLGETAEEPRKIHEFVFADEVPQAGSPDLNFRFNLWMFNGRPPADGQEVEAVIKSFHYEPLPGTEPFPLMAALVDPATFEGDVAVGGIASVFGTALASGDERASELPLPGQLADAEIRVNGLRCPLYYVSPGQLNFQIPQEVQPGDAVAVLYRDGDPVNTLHFPVREVAPVIFQFPESRQCIAQHADWTLVTEDNPAMPGDIVTAWLTGAGPGDKGVPTGGPAPLDELIRLVRPAEARVGGQAAPLHFIGLAPGLVGAGQANFEIPSLPAGLHDVIISIHGAPSPSCRIAVGLLQPGPAISSISPATGPESGGTQVTIAGENFRPGAMVLFGASPATNVVVESSVTIRATAPPGTGTIGLTVRNSDGQSAILQSAFTYQAPVLQPRIQARVEGCRVRGTVEGVSRPQDFLAVLYARTNLFYIQPCTNERTHPVAPDGTWGPIDSHNGDIYALLVRKGFNPPAVTSTLPRVDGVNVLAVTGPSGTIRGCDVARCPAR